MSTNSMMQVEFSGGPDSRKAYYAGNEDRVLRESGLFFSKFNEFHSSEVDLNEVHLMDY